MTPFWGGRASQNNASVERGTRRVDTTFGRTLVLTRSFSQDSKEPWSSSRPKREGEMVETGNRCQITTANSSARWGEISRPFYQDISVIR
eukprot:1744912-Pyramimonas_sp.AAC.1